MKNEDGLQRFKDAQAGSYATALSEIKNGKKRTHWMWYILPQVQGLGFSETSKLYALQGLPEAAAFLQDPVLGKRLVDICQALTELECNNPNQIFGSPDDLKLQSSMTLFCLVPGHDPVFETVLLKFFKGEEDLKTLQLVAEK